jgi:hypothetical protein
MGRLDGKRYVFNRRVDKCKAFFSSRLNWDPNTRRRVCSLLFGGGTQSLAGEGVGGPNSDERTDTAVQDYLEMHHKVHYRMPQCMSPRWIWFSHPLSRQRLCPSPRTKRGGAHRTLACGRRGGRVPIPTTGEKA